MCGRYSLASPDKLKKRYNTSNKPPLIEPSYNIPPGTINPVITKNSPLKIRKMKWGLIPFWAKDPRIGYKMINARAEGIEKKPSFRKPIKSQRCLIPATGFYEWKTLNLEGKEEKFPWYFTLKNQEIFSFAGIYDVWHDAEGMKLKTYSIITTKPNSLLKKIHDRMPVIIEEKKEELYLSKKTELDEILKMLKPLDAKFMESWPVSEKVNSPRNDNKYLIIEEKN